ncbi:MAG: hypothetical protein V4692_02895, partial [Bdellovibrionota bacterium]
MKSAFAASLRLGVILALTGVMVACTKSDISTDANRFRDTYGIFSTRPQTATETVVLLKLVSPALLTTAENGKTNADAAKALTEEQDLLISKMKALSPEIQVLYRYRLVINGIAVVSPISVLPQLRKLANVVYVETSESFGRPVLKLDEEAPKKLKNLLERNSVKFIGATEAHARGIRGQGLKVGIIDTGIDFTHAMFGGGGTEEIYKSIDPSKET